MNETKTSSFRPFAIQRDRVGGEECVQGTGTGREGSGSMGLGGWAGVTSHTGVSSTPFQGRLMLPCPGTCSWSRSCPPFCRQPEAVLMTSMTFSRQDPLICQLKTSEPNPPLSDYRQGWRGSEAVGYVPEATGLAGSGSLISHLSPYTGVSMRGH